MFGRIPDMSEKSKKVLKWSFIAMAALVAAALIAGLFYWNRMLNLLGDAAEVTVSTLSYEEEMALLGEEVLFHLKNKE